LCYSNFELEVKARYCAIDPSEQDARTQAVIENFKPACLCNKIRKGAVLKAIQAGAKTFEQVSKRTGVGTGPCGGRRCGSLVRGMLGEPVTNCNDCGWPVLTGAVCPRCEYAKGET
jgi:bacterioferritin-associated ferredoxin